MIQHTSSKAILSFRKILFKF